jgi:peptide/nickel transport system substrate-binding protein
MNARAVFERNDAYFGPKPRLRRITVEVIKDPSARVAAIQSGQVDLTVNVPVREVTRLRGNAALSAELNPITRIILLQVHNTAAFEGENVRLAAHHAIDKRALSQAFYAGAAVPLAMLATPGSPGFLEDFSFPYSPDRAKALLAKSGYGAEKPVRIRMATTNGQFPSDYDIARAIVAMWKKVGIEAELEVIEYAKYFELNRARKLPEATLYSFDNATADPEIFVGYLTNPRLPFSPWKDEAIGNRAIELFEVGDEAARVAGWKKLARDAAETGACMPLLQSVQTLVRKKGLAYTPYGNGWVLGQTMGWA